MFLGGLFLVGCSHIQVDDAEYFNGRIIEVNDKECQTKNVKWKELVLNGPNYGEVYVHDSIMVFYNTKLGDKVFNVFHVDSGEELGRFCEKGNGPNELMACSPMYNFFKENGELKTLLYAPHNNKMCEWNITQSLMQQRSVVRNIPYSWREENNNVYYLNVYALMDDVLVAKNQAQRVDRSEDGITLPCYQKRTVSTNQQIKKYNIYKRAIKNEDACIIPEAFFYSNDAIKPDGSKIVMAMLNLPQINIVDLNTGEVTGYRLKGGENFSVFKEDGNLKIHYRWVHADNKYIYASYFGKHRDSDPRAMAPPTQMLHIFDWEGNMKYRLLIKEGIGHYYVDEVRNRLYSINHKTDVVTYLDLNEILD